MPRGTRRLQFNLDENETNTGNLVFDEDTAENLPNWDKYLVAKIEGYTVDDWNLCTMYVYTGALMKVIPQDRKNILAHVLLCY